MSKVNLDNLKRAAKNPKLVLDHLKERSKEKELENRFISNFFPNKKEFFGYKNEISQSGLIEELNEKSRIFEKEVSGESGRGHTYSTGGIRLQCGIKIYSIIRKYKPQIAVETGVCNGFSTSFILLALHKNPKGRLYSIDYPEFEEESYEEDKFWDGKGGAVIPKGKEPGWLIPDYLRDHWELSLGKSQKILPPLLKRLKKIDFFMHDSEHSYECMWFEFNEAIKFLKDGGLLVSHDIDMNASFYDFSKKIDRKIIPVEEEVGLIIK